MHTSSLESLGSSTIPPYPLHELEQQLGLVASGDTHIELSRAADFISQVAEDGPAAKRSCSLTAQLNAHIAKGELDQPTAMEVQNELCTNPSYDFIWSDPMFGPDRIWRAWPARPCILTRILNEKYALSLSNPEVLRSTRYDFVNLVPGVENHLRQGGVAWLSGVSAVARHARIAFQPAHFRSEQLFIHDPHYSETTGLYGYDALQEFQVGPYAILY